MLYVAALQLALLAVHGGTVSNVPYVWLGQCCALGQVSALLRRCAAYVQCAVDYANGGPQEIVAAASHAPALSSCAPFLGLWTPDSVPAGAWVSARG
jgi:hypothetical protein